MAGLIKNSAWEQGRGAFKIESEALLKTADYIEKDAFCGTVKILCKAPRIGSSGCGHSGIACMHFAHLMCCAEKPARFISPSEAVHGASGFLQSGDVMLLASRGGQTAELLPLADICRKKKVSLVCVTAERNSPLALNADIVLCIQVPGETDRNNEQGTTSFVVMCALFDALQAALIEETDYRSESFALIHPGGAVGKRLSGKKN